MIWCKNKCKFFKFGAENKKALSECERFLKKIAVNLLTSVRFPLSVVFCKLITVKTALGAVLCVLVFAAVAVSDYFDGKLARRYCVQTKAGAVYDVAADFFFIFSSSFILYGKGVFPFWLLAVIVFKFAEFCLTSFLFAGKKKSGRVFLFDKIGRLSAVIFYVLPVTAAVFYAFLSAPFFHLVTYPIFCTAAALALVSTANRVLYKAFFICP